MKVACVLIPHFVFHAEARRQPELRRGPVILAATQGSRKIVADFSPQLSGVQIGVPLQAAMATAGKARIVESDEAYQRREFQDVLRALQQRCPSVQPDLLGCIYLDITGLEAMYGDDAMLALALQRALPQGFPSQTGIGRNKFVAYLAAQLADTGSAFKAPPDAKAFVQQFPVEYLTAAPAIIARLRQFGLKTLGDVASIGIGPLQTQFGPAGKRIWELANGVDTRPLLPMREDVSISASLFLPYANVSEVLLLLSLESLCKKLFAQREIKGKYAGRADVECSGTGSPAWRRNYIFKERLGSPDKVLVVLKSRLLPDPPRFYMEEVSLTLSDFAGESGAQGRLIADVNNRGDGPVAELAQRLQVRTGGTPSLYRVVNVDPDHPLPEMRSVLVPVNPEAANEVRPVNQPVLVQVVKQGRELTVLYPGKEALERATIQDLWKVDLWWLPYPANRTYFRATTAQGKPVTLFQDNRSGDWYVQQA